MKTQCEKIKEIIEQVHQLESNADLQQKCKIPSATYFLTEDRILSYSYTKGESRYLYVEDGRILTAYSSGAISLNEGIFNIILPSNEGKESNFAFFVGQKRANDYFPVSVFSNSRQLFESDIKRYTVFTSEAAYYFAESDNFIATVRLFLDDEKNVRCSFFINNITAEKISIYASTYINCFLWAKECDNPWTKGYTTSKRTDDGYLINVWEPIGNERIVHYAKILRSTFKGVLQTTTSQICYKGGKSNQLTFATPLKNGKFAEQIDCTCYKENPIAGDIIETEIEPNDIFNVNYTIACGDDEPFIKYANTLKGELNDIESIISKRNNIIGKALPKIEFRDSVCGINDYTFNCFLSNVMRQVEACSKAKNYAGQFLGVRDVYQQLEASLMWCPEYVRKKIIETMSFIFDDGRPPRQFSYPKNKDALPIMDTRAYIDQGLWIISTVYKYLSFTGDFSLLDEKCGYYKYTNRVEFSSRNDTVFAHLIAIINYLLSNIDENTGCLKILEGDWNDSLNGLGKSLDTSSEFGSGVSVMATLQLYSALCDIAKIVSIKGDTALVEKYMIERKKLGENILKNAVVKKDLERKVLHGWGDNRSYYVGSFCDNDGESRYSLTSAAFMVISKALELDVTLRSDLMKAFKKLDAKYGLNTFYPAFSPKSEGVGRIANMIKGVGENGATYNHATLFGIWALCELGEYKTAWKYLEKVIPITHDKVSTSPFIMSNSYIYNEELGLDGESQGDWYTGSACVLVKVIIWKVFGIDCDLENILFNPSKFIPFNSAKIELNIRNKRVFVEYLKAQNLDSCVNIYSDDILQTSFDKNTQGSYVIPFSKIGQNLTIKVIN